MVRQCRTRGLIKDDSGSSADDPAAETCRYGVVVRATRYDHTTHVLDILDWLEDKDSPVSGRFYYTFYTFDALALNPPYVFYFDTLEAATMTKLRWG